MTPEEKIGTRVSWITIFLNLILSIFKLIAGVFGHSMAMISDSIHSASDVFSTFIVLVGLKLSSKGADQEHPYGHERIESLSSLFLALCLFVTGCLIGYKGIQSFFSPPTVLPTFLAFLAAIISIISKELMFWYTRSAAMKIHSNSLLADAWHHRSDALSSVGSMIGILGSMIGIAWCDSLASFIICIIILKVSLDILKESVRELLDTSCSREMEFQLRMFILSIKGVYSLDNLKTRIFGNRVYTEVEIGVPGDYSLEKAHKIAHLVHDQVEEEFQIIKHCMVHVNPTK